MTNKFISMMDGIRQGIASVLTPRCHRSDSLSIVSRQSLLPIFLLCLTLFIGAGQMWGATYSGTFQKCTGTLTSGYYVFGNVESTTMHAVNNTVGTSWIKYTDVTISSNSITNPDASVVWYYDASAGTIKNSDGKNYIYWTSGNVGCCGTTSYAHTVTETSTSGIYTVKSKNTTSRILRRNATNGYRYYTTSTGTQDISFYKLSASCDKKVTVTKSSASNGSYTLKAGSASGATIDNNGTVDNCDANATIVLLPSANTHYHVDEVTASNSTSISGPDASGNYTITYTKGSNISTTIGVTFEPDPTYTVTWVAGSNSSFHTQTNYAGTALTDPGTPDVDLYCPGGKVFKGWTATEIDGEQDSAPADLFTSVSGKSIPVNGTIYYAVFATASGSGPTNATKVYSGANTADVQFSSGSNSSSNSLVNTNGYTAGKVKVKFTENPSGTKNYSYYDGTVVRFYANNTLTITPLDGATIKEVQIVRQSTTNSNSGTITCSGLTASNSNTTTNTNSFTGSTASAVTLTSTAQCRFTAINITYSANSTTYSNYATSCCTPLGSINGSVF